MQLDFEDLRPDVPRVASAFSKREAVLFSLVIHLGLVIFILLAPKFGWFQPPPVAAAPPNETVRFVNIVTPKDLVAPPKKLADASDIDRRAVAPMPVPKPENDRPASKGNTPEQVVAPPPEKAAGADNNAPPAPPTAPASTASSVPSKSPPIPYRPSAPPVARSVTRSATFSAI